MFSQGGIQGGEGVTGGEAWYIENVLEELDMEREWFYEADSSTLIYKVSAAWAVFAFCTVQQVVPWVGQDNGATRCAFICCSICHPALIKLTHPNPPHQTAEHD